MTYSLNKKLSSIYENGYTAEDIVDVYLVDEFIGIMGDLDSDGKVNKDEVVNAIANMNMDNDTAWELYLSKYDSEKAIKARDFGIDAKLYATATAEMGNIKADYNENGKLISGSRKEKIIGYLNSVCNSEKEYMYLLGTVYPSEKKQAAYIKYFGRED